MEEIKRKWWKKRTNWGLLLYAIGKILSVIPAVSQYSPPFISVGSILAGYGIAHRISNK